MEHERAIQNLAVECYLLGQMSPEERDAFETHYFECAVCADDLRAASQFVEDARSIFASERAASERERLAPPRTVSEPRPSWNWMGWLQPQFAAGIIGVLAIVVGVETLGTIPSLQRRLNDASAPRIVSSTFLRPQTRGEPTRLTTVSGEPAVFIFDLPESPPAEVRFVVKSTDGRTVFQLPGKVSGHGDQVTLSIPRLDLPAGPYALVVEAAAADGQELGQYPFEVKRPF
jgi:hypothetical protein